MWRPTAACAAVLSIIAGFALSPYGHVHPAGTIAGHDGPDAAWGVAPVKHTHFTPHDADHLDPPDTVSGGVDDEHHEPGDRAIVSTADEFLFQAAESFRDPAPAAQVQIATVVREITTVTVIKALQPPAHGPPARRSGPSRAPPRTPPAAV